MITQTPAQARTDRVARAMIRYWIWPLNGLLAVYAGLPWLSPWLRSVGFERTGIALFSMYRQFCHQLPERSFTFSGFPVCYCHRCTALYTSLLLMSLLYTVGRWRYVIKRRWALLLTLPMVVDGLWHMFSDIMPSLALRSAESDVGSLNFWLRMITGTLFGISIVLWAYPHIQREFGQA